MKKNLFIKRIKVKIKNKIDDFGQKSTVYFELFRLNRYSKKELKNYNCKKSIDKEYKENIKKYWKKYKNVDTKFHTMYFNVTNTKDVRFIPHDIYYQIIDYYFNKWKFSAAISDKNYYDLIFKDINRPKTIIKNVDNVFYDNEYNIISLQDAINKIKEELKKEELLIKPTIESQGGGNVKVFDKNIAIEQILKLYKNNYIIQKLVKQSKELDKIHSNSINTIRVISFLYNNDVIILSSVLRMGIANSRVDNFSSGGFVCGIDEKGCLKKYAYNKKGEKIEKHPSGIKFNGYEIKGYKKIIETIKEQHKKFAHFKLISWDFAINQDYEPVFIEFNLKRGGVEVHQICNGPIFGNLTDKVLEEVFKNKREIDKIKY